MSTKEAGRKTDGMGREVGGGFKMSLSSFVLSKKVTESDFHVKEMVLVPKERKQSQKQRVAPVSEITENSRSPELKSVQCVCHLESHWWWPLPWEFPWGPGRRGLS